MKSTQRDLRGGTLAVLVSACMLLCVLSPAIINWNGEEASASESTDDTFTYVSLGDSMVNAFGSADYYYYDEELECFKTCLGFLESDTFSYTVGVSKDIDLLSQLSGKEITGDVIFKQMATGGFRSEELRAVLYDDYQQDFNNGVADLEGRINKSLDAPNLPDDITDKEGYLDFFRSTVIGADLITYEFVYGLGTAISQPFQNLVNEEKDSPVYDYSKYMDTELVDIAGNVINTVYGMLLSYAGISEDMIPDFYLDMIMGVAEGVAYGLVQHCANFDAIMSWLYEVGYDGEFFDGKVVVLDSYSNYADVIFRIGMGENQEEQIIVPFGDIFQYILDVANAYTQYLSPWAVYTSHVDIPEAPAMMYDEFIGGEPSDDAKRVFLQSLFNLAYSKDSVDENGDPVEGTDDIFNLIYGLDLSDHDNETNMTLFVEDFLDVYNRIDGEDKILSEILEYIFSASDMDFNGTLEEVKNSGDIVGKLIQTMLALSNPDVYLSMDEMPVEAIKTVTDLSYSVLPNDKGACDVTMSFTYIGGDMELPVSSFTANEMSLMFVAFNVLSGDNPMSHPSEEGHKYLLECVQNNVSEISEVENYIIQALKEAASGSALLAYYVYGNPALLLGSEAYGELVCTVKGYVGALMEDPLNNLTRENVMVAFDAISEDLEALCADLSDSVEGLYGSDTIDNALMIDGMAWSILHAVVDDLMVYEGDELFLDFDPTKPYSEAYVGGVFSMFNDDPKDDVDFQKTLFQLVDDKLVESVASKDVIHIATASGNTWYIITELIQSDVSDYEPKDYSEMSGILGEELAAQLNALRDELAASMLDEEGEPTIMNVALDLAMYAYVGSLASTIYLIESVSEVNPDASFILYGTYNEYRGVDFKDGESIIPVGDILDKVYAAYDIIIYEIAEESDSIGFVDVSEATTPLFGNEYDITDLFSDDDLFDEDLFDLAELFDPVNLVPDETVFTEGAAEWINKDNLSYEITWITYDETFVEMVHYNTLPVAPVVEEDDAPDGFSFAGWDKEIVKVSGNATYTAVYEVYIEDTAADTIVLDKSVIEIVDVAQVKTDNWSVQIPTAVFDGLEGEVEISVKIVDNKDVPARVAEYAEGKKIVSLNLNVGGEAVSDFGDNVVTVTFAYQPDVGEKMDNISVFWIDDANYRTVEYPAYYDADTGEVTFDTTHFSYWFVGERTVADDEDAGNDYLVSIIAFIVIIVGLCGFLLRLKR